MTVFKPGDMVTRINVGHDRIWGYVIDVDGNRVCDSNGTQRYARIHDGTYLVLSAFGARGCNFLRVFCCRTLSRLLVNESDVMRVK